MVDALPACPAPANESLGPTELIHFPKGDLVPPLPPWCVYIGSGNDSPYPFMNSIVCSRLASMCLVDPGLLRPHCAQTRTNSADVFLESCGVLRTDMSADDEKFLGFPSKWVVPDGTAVEIFRQYAASRCDQSFWLRPLFGKSHACDCSSDVCHGEVLLELACDLSSSLTPDTTESSLGQALLSTELGEDEMSLTEDEEDMSFTICCHNKSNETSRGKVFHRPGWPNVWHDLIRSVRSAPFMVFWQIFAGAAVLTTMFAEQSWYCAPPLDVLLCAGFDVLNPEFLCACLGLIYEKRIRLLHLAPPCSTFAWAINRFLSKAYRSREYPLGLPSLCARRTELVNVGNRLVGITCRLAQAQESVGQLWSWEQPRDSIQWLVPCVMEFFRKCMVWAFHISVRMGLQG